MDITPNDPSAPNDADWAALPPELVDKILIHSFAGAVLHIFKPQTFPWHLGQICQSWRSVFVSSPFFWDRFTVAVPGWHTFPSILHMEHSLALVQLCLKRTKGHPFSFKFEMLRRTSTQMSAARLTMLLLYGHQLLQTLVGNADRWRDVYFIVNSEEISELAKANHRFENLRTIKVQLHDLYSACYKYIPVNVFEGAPNLERVFAPHYFRLPWSGITTLHLDLTSPMAYSGAELSQMTRLEELEIWGFPDVNKSAAIKLPSLKILSVDFYSTLSLIDAPALEGLYINAAMYSKMFEPYVPVFLRRVNHLKCATLDLPAINMMEILKCITDLDQLILSGIFALDALQQLMSSPVVYRLGRITVSHSYHELDVLLAISESWKPRQIMNLRSLSIYVYGEDTIPPYISNLMQDRSVELGFEINIDTSQSEYRCCIPFGDL